MTNVWAAGLLLMMTLCPAVGQTPFTLSVTRDVQLAEEHSNITLKWLFPVKNNKSALSLSINILYLKSDSTVFFYDSKNEADVYQDELYRGRVWCDPELARTGRIECLFTDLRLNDTGTYLCEVSVDGDYSNKSCDLNVTAASYLPVNGTSQAACRGRIGLYVGFGLFGGTTAALLIRYLTL